MHVKRSIIGPPSSHPSRLSVTLQTAQTEIFSTAIRAFLSFERKFYDLMSESSPTEMAIFIAIGVISTFFIIFIPLSIIKAVIWPLLFKTATLSTVVRKRRSTSSDDEPHLEFKLPDWMNQMERWVETQKPSEKRYRCCFYPSEQSTEGLARCFPLLPKFVYPWNNPCPKDHDYRDINIDSNHKLH